MLTKLTINNFKDLKSLSLEKLSKITIISGKNNIGKTSILEAILLLFDCEYSMFIVPAIANRSLTLSLSLNMTFESAVTGMF